MTELCRRMRCRIHGRLSLGEHAVAELDRLRSGCVSGVRTGAAAKRCKGSSILAVLLLLPALAIARPDAASLSPAIERLAESIRQSGDNRRLPFLIVDKVAARIAAFDANGRLLGVAPALLGAARGDHSVPGIGERPLAKIPPHERTTPAGRFVAELGSNMQGEEIVWIDYDAAVSLHRVRANNPAERRLQRLASPTPLDNWISWGCINIPVRYFDEIIGPMMRRSKAIAYVLPEVLPMQDVFAFVGKPATRTGKQETVGNRAGRPG